MEVAVQKSRGLARLELQNVDEEVKGGISVEDERRITKNNNSKKEGLMSRGRRVLVFLLVGAFLVMAMGGFVSAQQ